MNKYKEKGRNGITLVALVVTIVVLLILAGVSTNLVLGDNGIITKAKEAAEKTAQASQNDLIAMNELEKSLESTLSKNNGGSSSDEDKPKAKTLVQSYDDGELKTGDYVNYKPISNKTYTSKTIENGWEDQTYIVDPEINWRVFGKEDGKVLLISGSPIYSDSSNGTLIMKGAYAYENCTTMLNNICAIYSNEYGTARSITIEDVNKSCGIKVEEKSIYLESDASKTNIDKLGKLGNTYTYKASDYTPKSYVNGKSNATAGKIEKTTGYRYDVTESMKDDLLFPTTAEYWLAFPCTYVDSNGAHFGVGKLTETQVGIDTEAFNSDGTWNMLYNDVRPIITLKPTVTIDEINKIDDVLHDHWGKFEAIEDDSGDASNGEAGKNGNGEDFM